LIIKSNIYIIRRKGAISVYKNINLYTRALNASWKRNEVLANNIANVNTPGYKRSDVKFQEKLKESLQETTVQGAKTHESHLDIGGKDLSNITHEVTTSEGYSTRRDENNVDVDVEMGEVTKNNIYYEAVSRQMSSKFNRLRSSITGGR